MGVDSKGILRGRCTRCNCKEFNIKSVKCQCSHAPIHHIAISSQHSLTHVNAHGHSPAGEVAGKITYSEVVTSNTAPSSVPKAILVPNSVHTNKYEGATAHNNQLVHDPKQLAKRCHTCSSMYSKDVGACPSCNPRGDCENTSCSNMKYYDLVYGPFSYCSPSCRDQHLLPEYNRKLREYLSSKSSLSVVNDGTNTVANASGDASTEGLVISNSAFKVANKTPITPEEYTKQHTFMKTVPKAPDEVYYYHKIWNEGDKTGLYVTGLALGMSIELELADLIFGATPGSDFTEDSNYTSLTTCVRTSLKVKVYRKHDFAKVHEKINKEVKSIKNKKLFAFFLPYKREDRTCGIECIEIAKRVVISSLDKHTIAGRVGLQAFDSIHFIGGVKKDEMDKFTLIKVKDEEHFVKMFTQLKEFPNTVGLILITERRSSSSLV